MRLMLATSAAVLAFASPALASSVTDVTVDNTFPTNAAGADTIYDVKFKTSPTGALAPGAAITVTLPPGTEFDDPAGPAFGFGCIAAGVTLQCKTPSAVAAGTVVDLPLRVVTNPPTQSTGNIVTVTTAADADPADSPPFEIVAANPVDSVDVSIGFPFGAPSPEYRITVVPSRTGRLAGEISSRIHLTFPPEIDVSQARGRFGNDAGTFYGICGHASGQTVDCVTGSLSGAPAGDRLTVVLDHMPNAPAPGPYRLTVTTSSDPIEASTVFSPGVPVRRDTVIDDAATKINGATATFAFSQVVTSPLDDGLPDGGFECRVDAAPFARCTTPFTTPALSNGPHHFEVRGLTARGFEDLTPAARDFTIAVPPPAVYKRHVVTAPMSGKVKVCTAPGKGCHALSARVLTPVGRTIDARKGTIALTVATAKGAQQTVRVSGGVFKVTQNTAGTDLTLNQALGACARHHTRTLRVTGGGDFRVRGRYGTAARGTDWTVKDSCRSTVVRAVHGTLSVRDTAKRKTVTVRAGKRYVATRR